GQGEDRAVAAFQHRQRGLGQRGEAVGGNVVGDAEVLARHAVQEVAFQGFARGKADRVDQSVQAVPVLAQGGECRLDLGVVGNVAGNDDVAAEFFGEAAHAAFKAFADIGECQFGALGAAGMRDAVGDGSVRKYAGDQEAFAVQKAHVVSC